MLDFHKRIFPPLGHRIVKTAGAVFICLLIYMLRGFRGMVGQSVVAAILCMQPYVRDSKSFAVERIAGTILGGLWGLAFLLMMRTFPELGTHIVIVYGLMALFVMLSIYSTVVIKKSDLAALVAISLMGIVISWPEVEAPLRQTIDSVLDTAIGTVVAVTVNISHLPRRKEENLLFFVRTMDLLPSRYHQLASSVHIALDHLYNDGARICLVSRWAPAFIVSQMGLLKVNAPMIIMDGAALYDIEDNKYLDVLPIPYENAQRLRGILEGFGAGVNYYAVNEYTMAIYHAGTVNDAEKREREAMKRSPYRHYADGLPREADWIAFMRVIDTTEKIEELAYQVKSVLPIGMFRVEVREDDLYPGTSDLCFYDTNATVENMKARVQNIMEAELGQSLEPVNMLPKISKYLPEHDALLLLNRLKNRYEPVRWLPGKKNH